MNIIPDLQFRGLIYQVTDLDGLAARLAAGPIALYNGFDPTADSLTVGNLVPILLLRRFQLAGHKIIALAGGGTGLIGDPGGKTEERQLNATDIVAEWTQQVKAQLERFLEFDGPNPATMVDNYDWLGQLAAINFMRDVGKHFPVPYMLAKDSVASRWVFPIPSLATWCYRRMTSWSSTKNTAASCRPAALTSGAISPPAPI